MCLAPTIPPNCRPCQIVGPEGKLHFCYVSIIVLTEQPQEKEKMDGGVVMDTTFITVEINSIVLAQNVLGRYPLFLENWKI